MSKTKRGQPRGKTNKKINNPPFDTASMVMGVQCSIDAMLLTMAQSKSQTKIKGR
jgi:hypothetical protein